MIKIFYHLLKAQIKRYSPLFEQYGGHWALRRDLVWVPEKGQYDASLKEQPFIVSIKIGSSKAHAEQIMFGLATLLEDIGEQEFAMKAENWLRQNS